MPSLEGARRHVKQAGTGTERRPVAAGSKLLWTRPLTFPGTPPSSPIRDRAHSPNLLLQFCFLSRPLGILKTITVPRQSEPPAMDERPSKKPRFDPRNPSTLAAEAESDDENLDAADVGKTRTVKRGAVKVDGYDSDSSTENFNARADAKAAAGLKDDEDEDMFAEADKDEKAPSSKDKKKGVRFLETHEIEGQEDTSKSGGHVAADFTAGPRSRADVESSSDSGDDEERDRLDSDVDEEIGAGGKKKHAPKLDAFNMRKEQEEGRFDESGNYVRRARDPEAEQDNWLEGISKKDVKKAREAHEKREAELKEQRRADDAIVTSDVLTTLIPLLEKAETPMEALSRFNKLRPQQPKKLRKWEKPKKAMDIDEDPEKKAAADRATKAINDITESVSALERKGMEDVYDIPREMLIREYRNDTGEDWKDPSQNATASAAEWEFRYDAAPDVVHSAFPAAHMVAWKEQGHFDSGADFRRVGESEWSRIPDFMV
ncbi:hypothetical protein BCR34DRAFT_362992 [Clohesyomyces aquaticus]|uniref:GYF domain-containing protein n=1 Tax=Clohesyomyces aquaticus TaxID=1231657 RepID=A0A1Y1ZI28_9PLEO|nr:hypothetical protein BCR34DRAFT_362992 [Clohesyomyces aquaticus]